MCLIGFAWVCIFMNGILSQGLFTNAYICKYIFINMLYIFKNILINKVIQKLTNNVIQKSNSVAKNIVLLAQARLEVVDRELDRAPFTLPHVSQTYSDAIEKHHNLQDWRSVY